MDSDPRNIINSHLSQESTTPWELLHDQGVDLRMLLAVTSLFWPALIEVNGLIFVKENYDRDYVDKLEKLSSPRLIEKTVNTTYLYDFLRNDTGSIDSKRLSLLGRVLEKTWEEWAKKQFPDREFESKFRWHSPPEDDPGITLYQRRR